MEARRSTRGGPRPRAQLTRRGDGSPRLERERLPLSSCRLRFAALALLLAFFASFGFRFFAAALAGLAFGRFSFRRSLLLSVWLWLSVLLSTRLSLCRGFAGFGGFFHRFFRLCRFALALAVVFAAFFTAFVTFFALALAVFLAVLPARFCVFFRPGRRGFFRCGFPGRFGSFGIPRSFESPGASAPYPLDRRNWLPEPLWSDSPAVKTSLPIGSTGLVDAHRPFSLQRPARQRQRRLLLRDRRGALRRALRGVAAAPGSAR